MLTTVQSSWGVDNHRFLLINKLRDLGYTEDSLGKRTSDMTLPELEQISINLEFKQASGID